MNRWDSCHLHICQPAESSRALSRACLQLIDNATQPLRSFLVTACPLIPGDQLLFAVARPRLRFRRLSKTRCLQQ